MRQNLKVMNLISKGMASMGELFDLVESNERAFVPNRAQQEKLGIFYEYGQDIDRVASLSGPELEMYVKQPLLWFKLKNNVNDEYIKKRDYIRAIKV
jgi:hypothetical protein